MFNKIKNSKYEKHFEIDNVPSKANSIAEAFKIIKEKYGTNNIIKLKDYYRGGTRKLHWNSSDMMLIWIMERRRKN